MNRDGHGSLLRQEFRAVGDDWVELLLPWNDTLAMHAGSGIIASGPIISLLDNATGIAVWQRRGIVTHQVTVDLRLDYLRAPRPGQAIIGRGQCHAITGDLAFVGGLAYEDSASDPFVRARGTYMLIKQSA
ncbi:MAG: PaaI family thioesterase [Novosphingobium sp.]|nr:PaaI family thioesterase [Novosphingobium sp.]